MLAWKSRITATNVLGKVRRMQESGYDDDARLEAEADLASLNKLKVRPLSIDFFAPETLLKVCKDNHIPRRKKSGCV